MSDATALPHREDVRVDAADATVRPRIMIVDDDECSLDATAAVLTDEGYVTESFASATRALNRLAQPDLPNLIVLDLRMPGMSGWAFRDIQRGDPRLASIPVLTLSADRSPVARTVDSHAHLTKPVARAELRHAVAHLLAAADRAQRATRARHVAQLNSLGALAAGLAHELNNPLSVATGYLAVAQRYSSALAQPSTAYDGTSHERLQSALRQIETSLERMASIVREIGSFARSDENKVVSAIEVLESCTRLLANRIRLKGSIERAYADAAPFVMCSAAKLSQLFLILLLQAVSAIEEDDGGGQVIRLEVSELPEGHQVRVCISHSGAGLPTRLERSFDLLAATQAGASAESSDLSLVPALVEELGGSIRAESASGALSSYTLLLPSAASPTAPTGVVAGTSLAALDARAKVLVVDDEVSMCALLALQLEPYFDVSTEVNPRTALERLLEGASYDVILCDLMMPGMTGMDLHGELVAKRPEQASRMVFMTGGTFSPRAREFVARLPRYLQKPFSEASLLSVLREQLAARALSS